MGIVGQQTGQPTGGSLIRQFTGGQISGLLEQPVNGCQMSYDNVTRGGMSGGPVFDAGGRVIGIHGLGDKETPENLINQGISPDAAESLAGQIKIGFNYAIPINTFLARQQGIEPKLLQVENSPAPQLGGPLVAEAAPQRRDTIDDINDVLKKVNRVTDVIEGGGRIIDRVCRFFGC